jgi:hypothetical protein
MRFWHCKRPVKGRAADGRLRLGIELLEGRQLPSGGPWGAAWLDYGRAAFPGHAALWQGNVTFGAASGGVSALADTTSPTVSVSGTSVQATAGQEFSGIVATFTATDSTATASSFTATINWGDGTTSDGTVAADPNGGFDVTGTHTFASVGRYGGGRGFASFCGGTSDASGDGLFVISVAVTDTAAGTTATARSIATVAAAAPTLAVTGQNIQVTKGQQFSGTVAGFTDTDTSSAAGDFTATIDWGDGTRSTGTIAADSSGGFTVTGTHTYSATATSDEGWGGGFFSFGRHGRGFGFGGDSDDDSGAGGSYYLVRVSITDNRTGERASDKSLATIAPTSATNPTLTAANIQATAGQEFSGSVVTFTDTNTAAAAGDFKATINWGDGTTSDGTVAADPNGGFDVTGTHSYTAGNAQSNAEEGHGHHHGNGPQGAGDRAYVITVTVQNTTDSSSSQAMALARVTAAAPALTATRPALVLNAGTAFSGTVTTVSDTNTSATAADLTATIKWGDGTTSDGTVTAGASGGFDVSGSHTYPAAGTYAVTVTVKDQSGDRVVVRGLAAVSGTAASSSGSDQGGAATAAYLTDLAFSDAPAAVTAPATGWHHGTRSARSAGQGPEGLWGMLFGL